MAIQADKSNSFESPVAGIHNAVLTQVVDLGMVPNKFYDPNKKGSFPSNHQVVYVFQLETRKSDGTRFLKEFWFNLFSNPKSTIGKFLSSWHGRTLTADELTLDHETLIGQSAQLILGQNANGKIVITNAAPANPNSLLQIEPYDTNEYTRQLKERAIKSEDAAMGSMQRPQQQFQPNYQQPVNQGYPQQFQTQPPQQQYQPQPVQQGQTIQQYHQQQQVAQTQPVQQQQAIQNDGFNLNLPNQQQMIPDDKIPF